MKTTKRFYFAYGSNCNLEQMASRCPGATTVGVATLRNYTLLFNGVASISRKNGSEVKGVLWEITQQCERSLDRYEGFPSFYEKKSITVYTDGDTTIKAMVYVMTSEHNYPALPTSRYYEGIKTGFLQNGIPADALEDALVGTYHRIERMKGGKHHEQISLR